MRQPPRPRTRLAITAATIAAIVAAMIGRPTPDRPSPPSAVHPDSVIAAAMRDSYPADQHRVYAQSGWQYKIDSSAAGLDSIPVIDTNDGLTVAVGYSLPFCHCATNRHTGSVLFFVPSDLSPIEQQAHEARCRDRWLRITALKSRLT